MAASSVKPPGGPSVSSSSSSSGKANAPAATACTRVVDACCGAKRSMPDGRYCGSPAAASSTFDCNGRPPAPGPGTPVGPNRGSPPPGVKPYGLPPLPAGLPKLASACCCACLSIPADKMMMSSASEVIWPLALRRPESKEVQPPAASRPNNSPANRRPIGADGSPAGLCPREPGRAWRRRAATSAARDKGNRHEQTCGARHPMRNACRDRQAADRPAGSSRAAEMVWLVVDSGVVGSGVAGRKCRRVDLRRGNHRGSYCFFRQ